MRAAVELAAAGPDRPVKGEHLAGAQRIPINFLENILVDLRHWLAPLRPSLSRRGASCGRTAGQRPP